MLKIINYLAISFLLSLISCSNSGKSIQEMLQTADSLYQAGKYSEAVTPVMQASELARKDGNHYLSGRAEDLLADIIAATYGGKEAVSHRQKAASHYLQADSLRAHRYAMIDVAIAHANNDSLRRSFELLDSLRSSDTADTTLLVNCLRARLRIAIMKAGSNIQTGDIRLLQKYRHLYSPTVADYAMLAAYESEIPAFAARIQDIMPELAEEMLVGSIGYQLYLDSAQAIANSDKDKLLIEWATAECYKNSGQTERWQLYTDSLEQQYFHDSKAEKINGPVVSAQRDFQTDRADSKEQQASSLRIILICIIVLAIMAAVAGTVYYRMRIRMKNAEIESQMESLANLSKEINQGRSEIPALNSRIENLFRERWQTINFLCNEFFEKGDSENTRAFILNEVEKEIDRLKTPRKLRQIEASVNDCMDSLVDRMRQQCTALKEDDIVFLTLIYAGFSPRAVCMFTGMKLKSFYTRRTRLIARISASDAPDRELFIQRLSPTQQLTQQ